MGTHTSNMPRSRPARVHLAKIAVGVCFTLLAISGQAQPQSAQPLVEPLAERPRATPTNPPEQDRTQLPLDQLAKQYYIEQLCASPDLSDAMRSITCAGQPPAPRPTGGLVEPEVHKPVDLSIDAITKAFYARTG